MASTCADQLKVLLSDLIALSFRAQGYHWNVEGPDFSQYHGLFGDIYDDLHGAIDPTAENIRKLNDYAPYRMERFVELKTLKDGPVSTDPKAMAKDLLEGNEAYIQSLNAAFDKATEEKHQGIADFLAGRIDMHQKWSWFLRASLKV